MSERILFSCLLWFILLNLKYSECYIESIQGRESTLYIDLDIVKSNYEQMVQKLPPKHPIMAVVKANAYGIGAVAVSQTVLVLGAKYLGVAFVDEGVYLRRHGINAPILVLGYTSFNGRGIDLAIRYNLTLNVFSKDVLDAVQRRAMQFNSDPVRIHIKVNSGLSRLGLEPDELVQFVKLTKNEFYSKILVEGVFSHFASLKDIPVSQYAEKYARKQLNVFKEVVREARNVREIPLAHIANSGGILLFGAEASLDMVRPGSSIMGFSPFGQQSISLTSIISAIRKPVKGQQLGYQQNTTANGYELIATVALGYADGMRTECGNEVGNVLINGVRAPIVSGIMMDQMLVDVTKVFPVVVGQQVVIFGRQEKEEITIKEYAKRCGGTELSLTTQLNKRLPRIYMRNGKAVYFENTLLSYDVIIK